MSPTVNPLVRAAVSDDDSVAMLSSNTLIELRLFGGDIVMLQVMKKNKKTKKMNDVVLIAMHDESLSDGFVYLNNTARHNLYLAVGDEVGIRRCAKVRNIKRLAVQPLSDVQNITADSLFDDFLAPYFKDSNRPLSQGNRFLCRSATDAFLFKAVQLDPPGYGIVTNDTVIHWAFQEVSFSHRRHRFIQALCGTMSAPWRRSSMSSPTTSLLLVG